MKSDKTKPVQKTAKKSAKRSAVRATPARRQLAIDKILANRPLAVLLLSLLAGVLIWGFSIHQGSSGQDGNLSKDCTGAQQLKTTDVTKVPTNWKAVRTQFGFCVKLPSSISDKPGTSRSESEGRINSDESYYIQFTEKDELTVFLGEVQFTDPVGKSAFDNYLRNPSEWGKREFDESIRHETVRINGQLWEQRDRYWGASLKVRSLYKWTGDRAIFVSIGAPMGVSNIEVDDIQRLSDLYLYPLAASIKVQE